MFKELLLRRRCSRSKQDAIEFLKMPVKSIMTTYVVTTRPVASVISAATQMIAQDISCLIVAEEEVPLGIVTERDFLKKVPPSPAALKLKVKDIMTKKVVTISPEGTLQEAEELMRKNNFRKLVVTVNGKLIGVITQTDISKLAEKKLRYHTGSLVNEWMSKRVISVSPTTPFSAAKRSMITHDIGAMPIKKGDTFIGIFTEYDVVSQFYDKGGILSIKSPQEILTAHIRSIEQDVSVHFANRIMLEKKVRRLMVLDGKKVVGIITQTDITHAICEEAKQTAKDPAETCRKSDRKSKVVTNFVTDNLKRYSAEKF